VRGRGKGGRIRKRFKEQKAAKTFAREQFLGLGERGKAFFNLDTQKQNDVTSLVPVLVRSGESIDDLKDFVLKLERAGLSLSELSEGLQMLKASELGLKRTVEFGVERVGPFGVCHSYALLWGTGRRSQGARVEGCKRRFKRTLFNGIG
jgi:hypothetical protein